ncbi:MAG TPA: hypothetical protein VFL97_02790 [Nitrococcus sp.]|nr:hypothetical protein [Nitrococcus sp.]
MSQYLLPDHRPTAADNLFFAATSYHILMAHLLAADAGICPGSSVLVLNHCTHANFFELFQALRSDPNTPFRDVFFLGRPQRYKRRQRAWQDRRRLPALRRLQEALQPQRLFLFTEDALDQDLARHVKARGGQVFAVEDGAVAYSAHGRRIDWSEAVKKKLIFGPRTRNVTVEGSSPCIDAFFAVFPEHVRAELRHKPVHALPTMDCTLFDTLSWPRDYLRRLGIGTEDIACERLYPLAQSSNFKALPDYRARMRAVILQENALLRRSAISYHPSEKKADVLGVSTQGVALIHHAVPAELIYLCNRRRLREVIGNIGTSLLSARWMLPEARVISLMKYLDLHDPPFEHTLRAIGVELR